MTCFHTADRTIGGQFDPRGGLPSFLGFALKRAAAILVVVCCVGGSIFPAMGAVPEEMRGVWVVRHVLASPEGISRAVETARRAGLNALFVQVRGRGDAYYRSRLAPAGEGFPDAVPDFDPLDLVVREAHQAGMEVHAWVNVYLTWHPGSRRPTSHRHVLLTHPEWFMRSADGIDMGDPDLVASDLVDRGVEGRYLSPGVPEVRAHLLDVVEEIVSQYDIDGVHLDYVRYPNRHYDYNPIGLAAFVRQYRIDPDLLGETEAPGSRSLDGKVARLWERWRADQVSMLVGEVHRLIIKVKPHVRLSAAVKPDLDQAYRQYGQDWIRWVNKRMVDFVVPMCYTASADTLSAQILAAQKYLKKGYLYAGIGVYKHPSSQETLAQVSASRRLGLKGVVLFSYDSLIKNPETVDRLREGPFDRAARMPHMWWKQDRYGVKVEAR